MLGISRVSVLDDLRSHLTRREALGGVLGMAALALTAEADAGKHRGKHRKNKKKKRCKKDQSRCNGKCRNLQTDPKHCGGCGVQCAEDQNCVAGVCSVPCQEFACISNQIDAKQAISSVSAMSSGDLAVLVPGDSQILVLTTAGEEVRRVGSFGPDPGELWNPLDLSVANDDTFYVAEFRGGNGSSGRLQAFLPNGTFDVVSVGFSRNVGAGDGRWYGGDYWWVNRIQSSAVSYKFGFTGNSGGNSDRFDNVTGIAVAAGGKVYVVNGNLPDQGGETVGMVYGFTDNGSLPVTADWGVGGLGTGPGKFNNASGIAVSGDRVFVADTDNRRVQVLDAANGDYLFEWATTDRDGTLVKPESVTVTPDGTVYVTADEMLYGYTLVS